MGTRKVACVMLAAFGLGCGPSHTRPLADLTPEEWEADLDEVVEILTERHPDPFGYHGVDPAAFEVLVDSVRATIDRGEPASITLHLDRLVALVGDGHTSLDAVQARAGHTRLPLSTSFFGDELRVLAVKPGQERALGARVLALDGHPTLAALDSVSRLISRDNPQEFRYLGPTYLLTPGALRFAGVAGATDSVTLTLSRGDSVFEMGIAAWPQARLGTVEWVLARDTSVAPPLALSRPSETYWFEPIPDAATVYVRWNRVDDAPNGPSLGRFYGDLFETVDRVGAERLIVDLRQNNGGNFHKADEFLDEVLARPHLARTGGLYVLTAPRTFSAAAHVAGRLRFEANGLIVGEASRSDPNFAYNAETIALGRSGLSMEYTDEQNDPPPFPELGASRQLPVDIPAFTTFDDYLAGRDAVLEAALRHGRAPL